MSDIAAWPFTDGVDGPKKKSGDGNTDAKKSGKKKGGGKGKSKKEKHS